MKKVSFKVAKAIKNAGYPQKGDYWYSKDGIECYSESDLDEIGYIAAPIYIEVWLWLWRYKKCYIQPELCFRSNYESSFICIDKINHIALVKSPLDEPEKAIIEAIEYLVENDLIK